MNADAALQSFLPAAIAAGERAYARATQLTLPDGKPDRNGLATMACVTPTTLAILLDAAEKFLGPRAEPAGEA